MGFEILPITAEDLNNGDSLYDVFEITGSKRWTPACYCAENWPNANSNIASEEVLANNTIGSNTINNSNLFFYDPSDNISNHPVTPTTLLI